MVIEVPTIKSPPKLGRKRSQFHGWGIYTAEAINKNKRIIEYDGQKIKIKESELREAHYLEKGQIWCFRINRRWARDANVGGNDARFINHSCSPNCYSSIIGHTILICAARNIDPGEELTYNYYTNGEGGIPCRCVPNCKNLI